MAESLGSDAGDIEEVTATPTPRNKGKARADVVVAKPTPKATRTRKVMPTPKVAPTKKGASTQKRDLQDSPSRVESAPKRVRVAEVVEEDEEIPTIDLRDLVVTEFDPVTEEQVPGAPGEVRDPSLSCRDSFD